MSNHPCIRDDHSYAGCVHSCAYYNEKELQFGCLFYPHHSMSLAVFKPAKEIKEDGTTGRNLKIKKERVSLRDSLYWYFEHMPHISIQQLAAAYGVHPKTVANYRTEWGKRLT